MKLSSQGLELIKRFEGSNIKGGLHVAYRCPAGVPTIGYGHTHGVRMGDAIGQEQADRLLYDDVQDFEAAITKLVRVPLNQNQFDSLVSFTYNLGATALAGSTLLRVLNDGDYEAAASNFKKWVYAGGRVLKGLVTRRKTEEDLFRKPTGADVSREPVIEEDKLEDA